MISNMDSMYLDVQSRHGDWYCAPVWDDCTGRTVICMCHACCGVTPLMHEERKIPREEDWLITRESSACKSAAYSCDSSIYD